MRTSRLCLPAIVAVATAAVLAVSCVPASAAMSPALFDVDVHTETRGLGKAYSVTSECSLTLGYTTDPRFVNFVVQASADAAGSSVAVATSVQCTVYDSLDKSRTYGGASGALPGPHATAVGQATVPIGRVPAVCVKGGATYLDGTTSGSSKICP